LLTLGATTIPNNLPSCMKATPRFSLAMSLRCGSMVITESLLDSAMPNPRRVCPAVGLYQEEVLTTLLMVGVLVSTRTAARIIFIAPRPSSLLLLQSILPPMGLLGCYNHTLLL